MADVLKQLVLAGIMFTGLLVIMLNFVTDLGETTGVTPDITGFDNLTRLEDFRASSEQLKDQLTTEDKITSLDSVAGFVSVGLTGGKLILGTITDILLGENSLIGAVFALFPVPPEVYVIAWSALIIVVAFALIQLATGRVGKN